MIASTKQILEKAREKSYAVAAFNVSSIEVMRAILETAESLRAPVMVETSESEMHFGGAGILAAAFEKIASEIKIPSVLHLDHGKSWETVKEAVDQGYRSVHIDASVLFFDENVKLTRRVVALAHPQGIFVEGELGHIPGVSVVHANKVREAVGKIEKTDPALAVEFVESTGVDCLAVSIGNVHGLYQDKKILDFELLRRIRASVSCFLSLHGASGISKPDLKEAVSLGISKVNINTELRKAYVGGLREELKEHPEELKPYTIFPPALEEVKKIVKDKIVILGSSGQI